MASSSPAYSSYQMPHPNAPPAPPPKPGSHEVSRQSTPAGSSLPPPHPQHSALGTSNAFEPPPPASSQQVTAQMPGQADPGEQWLPKVLEDKAKHDLTDILAKPELVAALTHASSTIHPSVIASQEPLKAALDQNVALATHLIELETRLAQLRASTQAQLLAAHQLERQWKQKQSDMDRALAPFSPSSLYQRLNQGVQEQEMVCRALEESFLDGDGGTASEKEIADWIKRYRDAKKVYYSRRERKERWDEGRVGGWR